jgi:hypothetical protein
MVVFTHGKVKNALKIKKWANQLLFKKVVTFEKQYAFSYKAYGKV